MEISTELIVNGLIVLIDRYRIIHFERIEDYQAFYAVWRKNQTIDEAKLKEMIELSKNTGLGVQK